VPPKACPRSEPAISKTIAEMERRLAVPLLDRSARGVTPSAYGRVLLERGAAMLDELRQGVEEIRFLADPAQGKVRVGATEPITAASRSSSTVSPHATRACVSRWRLRRLRVCWNACIAETSWFAAA
jgi:DNA-binding transcriptional LysR family regulator